MLSFLQQLDTSALNFLRSWIDPQALWFPYVQSAISCLADSEVFLFALTLIGLWICARFREKNDTKKILSLQLFWTTIVAFFVYWILNHLLPMRPRPESVANIAPLLSHLPDNSFPSGHAIFGATSVTAIAYFWSRKATIGFGILAIIMGLARVFAGVHYPGDILVGWILGILLALVTARYIVAQPWFSEKIVRPLIAIAKYIKL